MEAAKNGDKVQVHYKGYLQDGSVFDTSRESDPLEVVLGEKKLLADFENAILGMTEGDQKSISVKAENGYGIRREELLIKVSKDNFPSDISPEVGLVLRLTSKEGQEHTVTVSGIQDEQVTLDGNHPLAGKDLQFDIELIKIY